LTTSQQVTLDGKVLPGEPEDEKAINIKVAASFSKQIVFVKDSFGEVIKDKKYKAVFSSTTDSVHEILNCINQECPEAVREWILKEGK